MMGMEMKETSSDLSLAVLVERCKCEISRFRQGMDSNDQYCLELFHRAISRQDQQAWAVLVDHFRKDVLHWMHRHPRREIACRFDSEENYVNMAFERFWQATTRNQNIQFTSLAAALRYLQTSLNGAVLDNLRAYSRPKETPLPEYDSFHNEPLAEEYKDGYELWMVIQGMFPNAREQRLAFLLFHCGLKPREVVQYCVEEFRDVREVYRLRRNIFERLQRNREHIRWQLSSSV